MTVSRLINKNMRNVEVPQLEGCLLKEEPCRVTGRNDDTVLTDGLEPISILAVGLNEFWNRIGIHSIVTQKPHELSDSILGNLNQVRGNQICGSIRGGRDQNPAEK